MTTFPLSAPPIIPATEKITLRRNQSVNMSPFTGHTTVVDQFSQWVVELGFAPVKRGSAMAFMGWIDSLQGAIGTFTYQPVAPMLGLTGKTLNAIAHAYTNVIDVAGWSGSAASGLKVGYFFGMGGKLYRITAAPANATAGVCTISFEPSVKVDVASGSALNFVNPTLTLRVVTGTNNTDGLGYSTSPDMVSLPAITASEAL